MHRLLLKQPPPLLRSSPQDRCARASLIITLPKSWFWEISSTHHHRLGTVEWCLARQAIPSSCSDDGQVEISDRVNSNTHRRHVADQRVFSIVFRLPACKCKCKCKQKLQFPATSSLSCHITCRQTASWRATTGVRARDFPAAASCRKQSDCTIGETPYSLCAGRLQYHIRQAERAEHVHGVIHVWNFHIIDLVVILLAVVGIATVLLSWLTSLLEVHFCVTSTYICLWLAAVTPRIVTFTDAQ